MTKTKAPCSDPIREAAACWLVARSRGMPADEEAEFSAWLRTPAHAEEWRRAERIWAEFDAQPDPLMRALLDEARAYGQGSRDTRHRGLIVTFALLGIVPTAIALFRRKRRA